MLNFSTRRLELRIVFMGTPEFAVPSLERLFLSGYRVVMVYTQPDKLAGRGRSLVPSAIKRVAQNLELPLLQPVNFRSPEAVAQLAGLQPFAKTTGRQTCPPGDCLCHRSRIHHRTFASRQNTTRHRPHIARQSLLRGQRSNL